jgi:hypothetical protein
MCIHFWIKKAAIDLATSRPRKRDVGASEELIDGRVATAYLHDANAGADAVMFYSDLDRLFDDLEQPAGNPQSVFRVHACQTQREFIVTDPRKEVVWIGAIAYPRADLGQRFVTPQMPVYFIELFKMIEAEQ